MIDNRANTNYFVLLGICPTTENKQMWLHAERYCSSWRQIVKPHKKAREYTVHLQWYVPFFNLSSKVEIDTDWHIFHHIWKQQSFKMNFWEWKNKKTFWVIKYFLASVVLSQVGYILSTVLPLKRKLLEKHQSILNQWNDSLHMKYFYHKLLVTSYA